jgi:hypothetical protein
MPMYVVLTPDELRLEQEADELLARSEPSPDLPVYTERQLREKEPPRRVTVNQIADLPSIRSQSLRDEMRFLASVSELTPKEAVCLRLWMDGWSQSDIAVRLGASQQLICRLLRQALIQCYDSTPLAFSVFSHHTIYRRPSKAGERPQPRLCAGCGEVFEGTLRRGRYCSVECAKAGGRA